MEKTVPQHVAIVMDGNGRWAQDRAHSRIWGHVRGAHIVSEIVEEAVVQKIKSLTLFTFSSENWARPQAEISNLFKLLKKFLYVERKKILANKIRFSTIGDLSEFPQELRSLVEEMKSETVHHSGLNLTLALGYGGRSEIISAVNHFIKDHPGQSLSEEKLTEYVYAPHLGDVDLLIRTGGDYRISNFLLWQMAYAELYFTPTHWPDFSRKQFREILMSISQRERRFGGLGTRSSWDQIKVLAQKNKAFFKTLSGLGK